MMTIPYWCIGVSEPAARIGLRESLILRPGEAFAAAVQLKALGLADCVLLSSCARFELFSGSGDGGLPKGLRWFDERARMTLAGTLRIRRGTEALRHVFRVASGLDSRVPADPRVTELVREGYRQACALGLAGPSTHRVFQRAMHIRVRVRQQARIPSRFRCFGEAAADILLRLSEDRAGNRLIVFGTGRLAEAAALRLGELGRFDILLCGRDHEKTLTLAAACGARAAGIKEGFAALPRARAALFACACEGPLLRRVAVPGRRAGPLTLIDAGLPRNVDPRLKDSAGVRLHDLDDIYRLLKSLSGTRRDWVQKAEDIVSAEIESFLESGGKELV